MGLIDKLLIGIGLDDKGLKSGIRRSKKDLSGFQKSTKAVGSSIAKSLGAIGAGFTIGSIVLDAAKTIGTFEQSVADLASISGKSASQMSALVDNAKGVGATSAFSATAVIALQTELAKLGNSESEIISMTKSVGDFSIAVGTTAAEAATFTGGVLKSFGRNANETNSVLNSLALATTKSALDFNKLATALPIVGTAADQSGVSLERTAALLGVLADRNIDASTSGTALRNIFLELKSKGLTYEQAMSQINGSTDKLNEANKLFGKRGAVVATVLAESGAAADDLELSITGVDGALDKMVKTRLDTTQGKTILLKSAWEGLVLSVDSGNGVLSEAAKNFLDLGTSILTAATDANSGKTTWESFFLSLLNPKQAQQIAIAKSAIEKYTNSIKELTQPEFERDSAKITKALFKLYTASGASATGAALQTANFFKTMQGGFEAVKNETAEGLSEFEKYLASLKTAKVAKEEVKTFAGEISNLEKEMSALAETFIKSDGTDTGLLNTLEEKQIELTALNAELAKTEAVLNKLAGNGETIATPAAIGSSAPGATAAPTLEGGFVEKALADLAAQEAATESLRQKQLQLKESYKAVGEALGSSLAAGATSFKQFATQALQSIKKVIGGLIQQYIATFLLEALKGTGLLGVFAAPAIGGLAAGIFNTAISSAVPALAEGGVVSGPRIVQVGEYAGASTNPEIIAPEKKLTKIFTGVLARNGGGGGGELFGELKGRDILLSNKREASVRKRTTTA